MGSGRLGALDVAILVAFAIYAWRVGAAGRLSPLRRCATLGLGLTGALLTLLPFAGELPAALRTGVIEWRGLYVAAL